MHRSYLQWPLQAHFMPCQRSGGNHPIAKINHLDTMGVPEGTKTSCMDALPTVPMNCKEVEVEAEEENNTRFAGEKHGNVHQVKWKRDFVHEYYTIEDKE